MAIFSLLVRRSGLSVLMYHSIANNEVFFTVKPEIFAKQMKYLKDKNYRVASLKKIIEILKSDNLLPSKTIALTFDDGFKGFYLNAWPILEKYQLPATVFLAVDFIGKTMNNSVNIPLEVMNWNQIRQLHKSGLVEFGSHTLSHPKLKELKPDLLMAEINKSKQIIEQQLQVPCDFFAAPKGGYDDISLKAIKKAGYIAAFGIKPGFINREDDLFALKRNSVNKYTTFIQFKAKL